MKLRTHWTPSPQVRGSVELLGTELLFPTVSDDDHDDRGEAPITTTFGLWCVDIVTGAERHVKAPFFVQATYIDAEDFKWIAAAQEDGLVVMTLSYKASYEFCYHLFTFDGVTWKQVVPRERTQQLTLWEQDFKTWSEPGELALSDFPLSGGALAAAGKPLTFAADFTHAFSYDSGPMTPTAPEYDATLARSGRYPPPGLDGDRIDMSKHPKVAACLPKGHRAHTTDTTVFRICEIGDDLIIIDEDWRGQVHDVSVIERSSPPKT